MHFELKKLKKSDAKSYSKQINNPSVIRFLRDGICSPYSEHEAEQYIAYLNSVDERKEFVRGIFVDNKAIGAVALSRRDNVYEQNAEIGYWIGEEYWNRGIMTEALKLMCRYAFEMMHLNRVEAEVIFENFASRKVLEKCGFTLEGVHRKRICKNGIYFDSCTYALVK